MKAKVSFAGLAPSTGVPKTRRLYFSIEDGTVEAKSSKGALRQSAMA
jgi:hypothetical protein